MHEYERLKVVAPNTLLYSITNLVSNNSCNVHQVESTGPEGQKACFNCCYLICPAIAPPATALKCTPPSKPALFVVGVS